ncbi:MAG TPA: glycosyltransferase family 39 protein [Patescibacteria group bacterium]|nr:glycosyltransferase family 39 protein [Patescibacteria group bacterium]
MKKFLKKYWPLILIAVLAFSLRVYKLGDYPVGLTWDEPALGYNAYSILETGRDEYGQLLPLTFKSFGDYKPGLFVYYLLPSVAVFGLNTFAIRLPSALAGVGTVIALFFLTKMLLNKRKEFVCLPYLAALLLAISPWQIHFSRGAWEVNLALLTIVLGVIFFLKSLETRATRFFLLTFVFLAASFYVYHGAKVFLVVFMFGALAIYRQKIMNLPKQKKILGLILLMLLLLPLLSSFQGSARRAKVTQIFSYTRSEEEVSAIIAQEESFPQLNFNFYHHEVLNKARLVADHYFNHLTGKFLFFEGDWQSPRHSTPYMGMMYYLEIPFLLVGIGYALAKEKRRGKNLFFWWLIASPVPAAITRDAVHGLRSYWLVIPLVVFTAMGINVVFSWLKQKSKKLFFLGIFLTVLGYLFCLTLYLDLYYLHSAEKNSAGWNYGTEAIAEMIKEGKEKYEKIVVTQEYGQPYIFYLFYTQYPPKDYQAQAYLKENPWGDVGLVEKIDNIEFRNIYWPEDRQCQNCLFIGDEFELPIGDISQTPGARLLEEIYFLDGRLAYRVVETE